MLTNWDILEVIIATFLGTLLAIWLVEEVKAHMTPQQPWQGPTNSPAPPDDEQPATLPTPEPETKTPPALARPLYLEEFEGIVRAQIEGW